MSEHLGLIPEATYEFVAYQALEAVAAFSLRIPMLCWAQRAASRGRRLYPVSIPSSARVR